MDIQQANVRDKYMTQLINEFNDNKDKINHAEVADQNSLQDHTIEEST